MKPFETEYILYFPVFGFPNNLFFSAKTTSFEYSNDKKRSLEYGKKLAKMIQVETVSHRDDPEVKKFLKDADQIIPSVHVVFGDPVDGHYVSFSENYNAAINAVETEKSKP